jgi:hypothetical protein
LSVTTLWAEQKIVPELPTRKLSRALSGAPGADADARMQDIAAATAITVLRM